MKKLNTTQAMSLNGGKTVTVKCCICKQRVTSNYWGQYWHCVKHASKLALPLWKIAKACFGVSSII
ncbi:MAG: hypothetical protein IJC88_05275 [Oscillospiraceae bacterium]|nr:hypothetical protein [Oscillospiraceae bacterium]